MRIHRIHLQHVAGVDDRELTFDDGVTVVVGPNETGKSTIATALQLLLEQKDRYDNAEIRAIRPVHADADPTIELECTTGPYHLTFRKCFGSTAKRRETQLTIHTPTPDSLTGDAAHERMRSILDETVDEQLWAALRVQQRRDVGQADLTASGALAAALDTAGGAGSSGIADDGSLLERVQDEAARFWTDTGRPRKPLVAADADVADARARLDDARAELDAAAEATRQHDGLVEQVAEWRRSLPQLELRAKETADLVAEVQVHRTALADAQRLLGDAEAAAVVARDAVADRRLLDERAASLRTAVEVLTADTERALSVAGDADDAVGEARRDRDHARTGLDEARRHLRLAEDDVRLLRLGEDGQRLTARIADAQRLQQQRADALARHDADAPSAAAIRRLDRLQDELRLTAAVLDAGLPRLHVTGPAGTRLRIGDDRITLDGDAVDRPVDADVAIVVDDVTLTVVPGQSAAELADRHADAVRALRTALDEAGVDDVAAARDRRDAAADARRELDRTAQQWDEVKKADGVDGLRAALARTDAARVALRAERPADRPVPIDVHTADRAVLAHRSSVADAERAVSLADAAVEAAVKQASASRGVATERSVELRGARDHATQAAAALDRARADTPDEQLRQAVDDADVGVDDARAATGRATRSLDALDVGVVVADAEAAEQRVVATRRRLGDAETDRAELWGRISVVTARGLGEQVPALDAALGDAEARRDSLRTRAEALLLLRETLHRHRDAAVTRYQAPLKVEIERLGRVVFGSDFTVELDESLRVVRRASRGRTLDVGQLSGGAQEQLAIITRLAAASLVDPDDGVPLILDDALGYADPARTDRVNTLLSAVGETSQVIVLTCDPDRFTAIRDAAVLTVT